jgi:carboxyl-terminal processing protease
VSLAAALFAATSALAQLSSQDKEEVLQGIDEVLTKEAFVPGVDLRRWRPILDRRQDQLDEAETPRAFAAVVNSGLQELGISHIRVTPSRIRRGWDTESMFGLQQRRFGARPAAIQARWLNDDAAFVRLSTFDTGYSRAQSEAAFDEIKDARYLVLDLRGNPGGEVENMRHFLGLLIPADRPVGTFVTKRLADSFVAAGKGDGKDPVAIAKWADRKFGPRESDVPAFKGKIAVLIDGNSASAAEIVANALHEIRKSPLVGTPSAGAVLMSTFERLPHGFRIQFPVSDYISVGGKRLEGRPVTPDLSLPASEARTDAAVDAALERLEK